MADGLHHGLDGEDRCRLGTGHGEEPLAVKMHILKKVVEYFIVAQTILCTFVEPAHEPGPVSFPAWSTGQG